MLRSPTRLFFSPYLFNILVELVMRETLDGFQGGLQIGRWMITSFCYADDVILLATSEAELQELVDRLDRVKYSLLIDINIDKTKVMASDGIASCILIQSQKLEQMNTLPYLASFITENGKCMTEFCTRLNRWQVIGTSLQKIWKSHSISISRKMQLMKVLVWCVAAYCCESWTLRKNYERCLDVFEMKGLRKILRVSWTAKKTNEWVLSKARVRKELLNTIKAKKLVYYGHTMRNKGVASRKR